MMESKQAVPPPQMLMQLVLGKFVSQSLSVVAELGIADWLKNGPMSSDDLAKKTETQEDSLYRVMRTVSAFGIFNELSGKKFENNDYSTMLRSDVQGSMRAMVRWINEPCAWAAWGKLDYSVKTGKPAFDEVWGMQAFEYFKQHEKTLKIFQEAMTSFSAMTGRAVAQAYDFSKCKKIVDVGGGHGTLLQAVIEQYPNVQGIVFDLPEVVEGANEMLIGSGHADRVHTDAGNFFDGVTPGADLYMMKHIIHDWDDERCVKILSNCRKVMAPHGKVLIIEQLLSDRPEGVFAKLLDLEMLVMTPGGRERSEAEFASLFAKAGLKFSKIVPTESPVCIVEGTL